MNRLFPSIEDDLTLQQSVEASEDLSSPAVSGMGSNTATPKKFQALTAINLNLLKNSQILYSPHSNSATRRPSLPLAQSLHSQDTDHEEERHSPTQPILIGSNRVVDEKTAEIMTALEFKNIEMLTLIKSNTTPRSSIIATSSGSKLTNTTELNNSHHLPHERRGSTRSDQLTHTDTTEDIDYDDDDYLIGDGFLDHVEEVQFFGQDEVSPDGKLRIRTSSQKGLYAREEDDDLDEDIFGMEL